jgi:hypothetical protein
MRFGEIWRKPDKPISIELAADDLMELWMAVLRLTDRQRSRLDWSSVRQRATLTALNSFTMSELRAGRLGKLAATIPVTMAKEDWRKIERLCEEEEEQGSGAGWCARTLTTIKTATLARALRTPLAGV